MVHWLVSASDRPGIELYNFGCLPGTLLWEHPCPDITGTTDIVLYQARLAHSVRGRGAIGSPTSQRIVKTVSETVILREKDYVVSL